MGYGYNQCDECLNQILGGIYPLRQDKSHLTSNGGRPQKTYDSR
jgi:hypothetical protein